MRRHGLTAWIAAVGLFAAAHAAHAGQVMVDRGAVGTSREQARIVGEGGVRVPPAAASRIAIARDEMLVARTGDQVRETVANDRRRFELPLDIVAVSATGMPLNLGAVIEVAGGGMRLRGDGTAFVGQIFVGIEDRDNPTGSRALARRVRFLVTAAADSVSPQSLELDHANLPYEAVQIESARPGGSITVRVRPDFEPEGFDVEIPVVRPALLLRASPPVIQGLGLETTDIIIGVDGAAVPPGTSVALSTSLGRLVPPVATFGEDGLATASIRSSWLGRADVTARNALFAPGGVTVRYRFPWPFAAAVVLGGMVGGALRYGWMKAHHVRRIRMVLLVRHAVLGIGTGLVVATAYAVGINLLNLQAEATTGEALVFVLSAIGALASGRLVKEIGGETAGGA